MAHDVHRPLRFPTEPHGLLPVPYHRVVEYYPLYLRVSAVPVTLIGFEHESIAGLGPTEVSLDQLEWTLTPEASLREVSVTPFVEFVLGEESRGDLKEILELDEGQAIRLRKAEPNGVLVNYFKYCLIRKYQEPMRPGGFPPPVLLPVDPQRLRVKLLSVVEGHALT